MTHSKCSLSFTSISVLNWLLGGVTRILISKGGWPFVFMLFSSIVAVATHYYTNWAWKRGTIVNTVFYIYSYLSPLCNRNRVSYNRSDFPYQYSTPESYYFLCLLVSHETVPVSLNRCICIYLYKVCIREQLHTTSRHLNDKQLSATDDMDLD